MTATRAQSAVADPDLTLKWETEAGKEEGHESTWRSILPDGKVPPNRS
jgi:hypothetical protein